MAVGGDLGVDSELFVCAHMCMGPGVPCKPGLSGHLHPAFISVKLAITCGFGTEAVVDRPVCAQLISKKEPLSL